LPNHRAWADCRLEMQIRPSIEQLCCARVVATQRLISGVRRLKPNSVPTKTHAFQQSFVQMYKTSFR
jgi:hypothetical protein